jgi:hypothetical protein
LHFSLNILRICYCYGTEFVKLTYEKIIKNMSKNLYIDASHPNETRVVLKNHNHIEDYEYESLSSTLGS